MTWYVHRRDDGTVASAHRTLQTDYAEEALPDNATEILALQAPPVPLTATAAGLIRALYARGLLSAVDAAVAQSDALTQRLWARTPVFYRTDPMLIAVAAALGMTDQLDALFVEANSY